MAGILASQSCYCRSLGYSSLVSTPVGSEFVGRRCNGLNRSDKSNNLLVRMRQAEAKLGTNGRAVQMVPTSEVMKKRAPSIDKEEIVNGPSWVVNGTSIVKQEPTSSLVVQIEKFDGTKGFDGLPPLEELKVLPSDEGFSWASENYSSLQRSIDVWSFIISLRISVLFDNDKWAYTGGFTEDKQVCSQVVVISGSHSTKILIGSFSPREEAYTHDLPAETIPCGIFVRGSYFVRTKFVDEEGKCYMDFSYYFEIRKK